MIPLREAQQFVHDFPVPDPGTEMVPLERSPGRTLAESPRSDQDQPPFDRVTMDGYALRSEDLPAPGTLVCVGEVAAGQTRKEPLQVGQVVRVMTGAPLPPGADAVIPVEETRIENDRVHFAVAATSRQNVHPRGVDLPAGSQPLHPGTRITTATVALLATLGRRLVRVYRPPSVSILTTGDELVEPDSRPGPGQIRDSNRFMLAAQCHTAGASARCLPIARDHLPAIEAAVREGLESDVLLLTGGSSVGQYDYSGEVIASLGARRWFGQVAIKPGKPVLYFTRGEKQIFCLPGNPVSAFVTFELLVRPALERRARLTSVWPRPLQARITSELRAPTGRDLFQIARLESGEDGWSVHPIRWSGSGDLVSVANANALLHLPARQDRAPGDPADVFPLRRVDEDFPRSTEPGAC